MAKNQPRPPETPSLTPPRPRPRPRPPSTHRRPQQQRPVEPPILEASTEPSLLTQEEPILLDGNGTAPSLQDIFTTWVSTKPFVPGQCLRLFSATLVKLIEDAVSSNTVIAWTKLFAYPKCVLSGYIPRQRGEGNRAHSYKTTKMTLGKIRAFADGKWISLWHEATQKTTEHRNRQNTTREKIACTTIPKKNWRDQVISKAFAGNLSNAFKFLIPTALADTSKTETIEKLRSLHPSHFDAPSTEDEIDLDPAELPISPPFQLNPKQLDQLIKSFPRGTAPGPDGFRAQYLRDLLRVPAGDIQSNARPSLHRLITLLVSGNVPKEIAPYLAGARLIPLEKKDGGIRPIAVGCVWRRLAAKALVLNASDNLGRFFHPYQMGVRTMNGSEVIIKAVQHLFTTRANDPNFVIFQADFNNAFNNISRCAFRAEIVRHFPEMAPWVNWCYQEKSYLFVSNRETFETIESTNGAQQGDPLGPLLFAIALQKILREIHAELTELDIKLSMNCWFLDDGTVAGTPEAIAKFIELLTEKGPSIGLLLNLQKSTLIWPSNSQSGKHLLPPTIPIASEGIKCLGIPIGTLEHVEETLRRRMDKHIAYLDQLRDLQDPQVGVELLTMCGSFCRFSYEIRAIHPSITQAFCKEFDNKVMNTFEQLNGLPPLSADVRTQISLPIKNSGFGLRSTEIHSMAAYTASHNTTTACIKDWNILQDEEDMELLPKRSVSNEEWTERTGIEASDSLLNRCKQSELSEIIDDHTTEKLRNSVSVPNRARLFACCGSSPGAAIHVPLAPVRGFRLEPHEYQIFVKYRLGLQNLCLQDDICTLCKSPMDSAGYHMVNCKHGGSVVRRHDAIRDVIFNFCQRASWNPSREIACLQAVGPEFENLVPADIFIPGIPAAVDITVVHPLQPATVALASTKPDVASTYATKRKMDKYEEACIQAKVELNILAMEFYGRWSRSSQDFFGLIASAIGTRLGTKPGRFYKELERKIAVVHWKMTARAVMLRYTDHQ